MALDIVTAGKTKRLRRQGFVMYALGELTQLLCLVHFPGTPFE